VEYRDELCLCVCVCVCVYACVCLCLCSSMRDHIQNYTSDLHQIFVHVTYGCSSVLLWPCNDTLCISGFMDDVIFAHKLGLLDVAARLRQ